MLSQYLQRVGILRWDVEFRRIDVFNETVLMSQYQDNPQIGHLEVLYHMFLYLNSHMQVGHIGYNPMGPNVDFLLFNDNVNLAEFYGDIKEELPPKISDLCGRAVSIFLNDNHAGNVMTRLLRTGIITFI